MSKETGSDLNRSKEWFARGTHLERLALVRNHKIEKEIVEKIFDHNDSHMGITLDERRQLVLAYLTNTESLKESYRSPFDFIDGKAARLTILHFQKLWLLASDWPAHEIGIKAATYQFVGTDDETKAQTYIRTKNGILRYAILENCSTRDAKTLRLGINAEEDSCRHTAYSSIGDLTSDEFEAQLNRNDVWALGGLAGNEHLPVDQMVQLRNHFLQLDAYRNYERASMVIRKIEARSPPKQPKELFGSLGRRGNFLEEKIDYIGNKLIEWHDKNPL